MTPPAIVSVNVGQPREVSWATELPSTCIDKRPVGGPVRVGRLGLEGDAVSDRRHHGGEYQAVYAYAEEDYAWWAAELGVDPGAGIAPGTFGENLTVRGLDLTHAPLGQTWRVGTAVLKVLGVRIPCRTFKGRMAEAGFDDTGWVRRFTEAGRPGPYLGVVEEGVLAAGDPVEIVHTPDHGLTVETLFRAFTTERSLLPELLRVEGLKPSVYDAARDYLSRRA